MATQLQIVSGADGLAHFRQQNGAAEILRHLREHSNVLVDWQVGVGKSYSMDQVTLEAIASDQYDLVIVLTPTRNIIDERALIKAPSPDLIVRNIQPRPFADCGEFDEQWMSYEKRGLAALGKWYLCEQCPSASNCFWPNQYGKVLEGSQVIYATQAHLQQNPFFLPLMVSKVKANRPLIIFDEAQAALTDYSRVITAEALLLLEEAINTSHVKPLLKDRLRYYLACLMKANTADLQGQGWSLPSVYPNDLKLILATGEKLFGEAFSNVIYDLQAFGLSDLSSREKLSNGSLRYSAAPFTSDSHVLLYSATTHPEIQKIKLGLDFYMPYENVRFKGEGTTWLNISSSIATATNFKKNSPQILDAFLELMLKRIASGKRVLLVSKKRHVDYCLTILNQMLAERGKEYIKVILGDDWVASDAPTIIPIIHYGVIGINKFEHFDCCYCLNSFYVNTDILSDSIQELRAEQDRVEVQITASGYPRRRQGSVADDRYRFTDVARVVDPMLQTLELGVAIQAVGRVRPFTKPREIITFQSNHSPQLTFDAEFTNLEGFREYFGLKHQRQRAKEQVSQLVQRLLAEGYTQKEVANRLGISERTVRRHKSQTNFPEME